MTSRKLLLKEIETIPDSLTGEIFKFVQSLKEELKEKSDFFAGRLDLDVLAAKQGIKPLERLEDLYGDFWPEDENIDDFIAQVREWRDERYSRE